MVNILATKLHRPALHPNRVRRPNEGLEAGRLVISLNTVRFYVKEIYSKLQVNNRTRAVKAARVLGLL